MLHTLSSYAEVVYAFEPVLDNYVLAKRNIANLKLENVTLFNAGLGKAAGFAIMQTRSQDGVFRGGASSMSSQKNLDPALSERVPVLALDELKIANVSLLHLDVECFEREVLTGARLLIAASKPIILIEDNKQNCAEILEKLGYRHAFHRDSLHYWAMPEDFDFMCGLNTG